MMADGLMMMNILVILLQNAGMMMMMGMIVAVSIVCGQGESVLVGLCFDKRCYTFICEIVSLALALYLILLIRIRIFSFLNSISCYH